MSQAKVLEYFGFEKSPASLHKWSIFYQQLEA